MEWTAAPTATKLSLDDLEFTELSRDLRDALLHGESGRDSDAEQRATALFRGSISEVVQGIQRHGRFALLKRFIAHGSLLPSWEEASANSANPLSDEELGSCVNFVSGHMVTKFQGELAEILARPALEELLVDLKKRGVVPHSARLVPGSRVRCRSSRVSLTNAADSGNSVKGPDGLLASADSEGNWQAHALVEVKSAYTPPGRLQRQSRRHLNSLRNGFAIDGEWLFPAGRSEPKKTGAVDPSAFHVYVLPRTWKLDTLFHFEATESGRVLVMEQPVIPPVPHSIQRIDQRDWRIHLRWSRGALRSSAFTLTHLYMREVGDALAQDSDPSVTVRADMLPADAGMNDFLHQLHVAIVRHADVEPDQRLREKTIELFNVLAFGWALGHGFRDEDGRPTMMYSEDLDDVLARKAASQRRLGGGPRV